VFVHEHLHFIHNYSTIVGLYDFFVQLEPVHVGYLLAEPDGVGAALISWVNSKASRGIQRHHALADAIALRARFLAVHTGAQGAS